MTTITTDRLIMTPVTDADMEDLLVLWSDPDFTRYTTGRPLTEEEVWVRCLRDIGHWQARNHGNWTLRERQTGDYVGCVGVLDYRRDILPRLDDRELGWGLSSAYRGKGYGLEAVSAALDDADKRLGLARTVCMISPENLPSIRLAEKLGYQAWVTTRYKDGDVILFERMRPSAD